MKMNKVYVDVGGSKTRFFVVSSGNRARKKKEIPTNMTTLVPQLSKYIKSLKSKKVSINIGLRGVWTTDERAYWRKRLKPLAPKIKVQSDVELAHELAFGSKPGLVINAGTGSICFGRDPKGKTARSGGMGPLIGDEGSAFWIGREFLKMHYLQTGKEMMARKFVRDPNSVSKIAGLGFEIVKEAEREKTGPLNRLVKRSQDELVFLILQVLTYLNWRGPFELSLRGGLFENSSYRKRFIYRLDREKFTFSIVIGSL